MNSVRSIIFTLICFIVSGCELKSNKTASRVPANVDDHSLIFDTSTYTVFNFDSVGNDWPFSVYNPFPKTYSSTTLADADLIEIEKLLNTCIEEYDSAEHAINKTYRGIDLHKYKMQLVPVVNSNGEKEVWINCFCNDEPSWKKSLVGPFDGGNCFFNLKVNLAKNIYYDLSVNSDA